MAKTSLITIDDLSTLIPAAFADSPAPDVSNVYEFIPTMPIVNRLMENDWTIRSAHQNDRSDPYASHRIVFDVPGVPAFKKVGDVYPTATLYNSHNRTRRFTLAIGFFRTWCTNQAQIEVLGNHTDRIHIKGFMGVDFVGLINGVLDGLDTLPQTFNLMREKVLTPVQRGQYAKEVLSIRHYSEPRFSHLFPDQVASEFLSPRRKEDVGYDLWKTYNVAQEAVLHGTKHGVQDVNRNRKLNLALWDHAQSWLINN